MRISIRCTSEFRWIFFFFPFKAAGLWKGILREEDMEDEEDEVAEAGRSSGRLSDSEEPASQQAESQTKERFKRKGRI